LKAAIYGRVSSDEQRERQTIQTQVELADEYCQSHGLAIYDHYLDDGVSGTVPFAERPAGSRLVEDARNNAFETVVIKQTDREMTVAEVAAIPRIQPETVRTWLRSGRFPHARRLSRRAGWRVPRVGTQRGTCRAASTCGSLTPAFRTSHLRSHK
jgi:predicted site-specific integrase-resolvase